MLQPGKLGLREVRNGFKVTQPESVEPGLALDLVWMQFLLTTVIAGAFPVLTVHHGL
jgi:hypothetical protein